ncbi:hypothetical protein [Urinicoccus massiliensis]|uniref:hypothetical protein n=1 Tax=Urinicoccus massiliensis TaxID=1723382 RepID=UPI001C6146DF|nr:hypothetical protein [Urinicoccus massiliensis]
MLNIRKEKTSMVIKKLSRKRTETNFLFQFPLNKNQAIDTSVSKLAKKTTIDGKFPKLNNISRPHTIKAIR